MKIQIKGFVLAFGLIVAAASVRAEDVNKQEFHFSPYFWLPSMDVTSTLGPVSVPIKLDFDDIWENFDVFAISARGEYWWGQFGVVADGLWMDMQKDNIGPLGGANLQISDGIVDILAAYRFNLQGSGVSAPSMRLLAGGRYHYLKQEVSNVPLVGTVGGSKNWMEPVLGAQLLAPMSAKWMATARGDVGGFGVSDASDITWSAMAGVGYEFARNWMAKLGYRYYYIDYSSGSGLETFGLEGDMHGPWIGISYGR